MNRNMSYVYGNTALDPNTVEKHIEKNRRQIEFEEYKRRHKNQKRKADLNKKLRIVAGIVLSFVIAFSIVKRYSDILQLERQINKVENQISEIDAVNEDLRIQLLKLDNISSVESLAKDELGMFLPSNQNCVSANLNKDNFTANNDLQESKDRQVLSFLKK